MYSGILLAYENASLRCANKKKTPEKYTFKSVDSSRRKPNYRKGPAASSAARAASGRELGSIA